MLSLDARSAFHRTVLRLLSAPFLIGARSHLLNTVVERSRPQTERATDSAISPVAHNALTCAVEHRDAPGGTRDFRHLR